MVKENRVNVFIARDSMILPKLVEKEYEDIYMSGTVFCTTAHTYMLAKHAGLAQKVSLMFSEMEASGELARVAKGCGYSLPEAVN